jgi:hypothetical protein
MRTKAHLDDLWAEFQRGKIVEALLVEPHYHVHGLCDYDSGAVIVNPQPHTVAVLLHELLHRRYPRWSEARVEAEALRLLGSMDDATVATWFKAYRKAAKRMKRPIQVDR